MIDALAKRAMRWRRRNLDENEDSNGVVIAATFSHVLTLIQTFVFYGVFVWRWNTVDENFWRENEKENFFRVFLVGWRGRKINGDI